MVEGGSITLLQSLHLLFYSTLYTKNLLHQVTKRPLHNKPFIYYTQNNMITPEVSRSLLHRRQLEPKRFYTRNSLHQTTSTTERDHTRTLCTKELLLQAAFAPQDFYTRIWLHQEPFTLTLNPNSKPNLHCPSPSLRLRGHRNGTS